MIALAVTVVCLVSLYLILERICVCVFDKFSKWFDNFFVTNRRTKNVGSSSIRNLWTGGDSKRN
jgi:hypothetical protein